MAPLQGSSTNRQPRCLCEVRGDRDRCQWFQASKVLDVQIGPDHTYQDPGLQPDGEGTNDGSGGDDSED